MVVLSRELRVKLLYTQKFLRLLFVSRHMSLKQRLFRCYYDVKMVKQRRFNAPHPLVVFFVTLVTLENLFSNSDVRYPHEWYWKKIFRRTKFPTYQRQIGTLVFIL